MIQKVLETYYEPEKTEEDFVYTVALGFVVEEFQKTGLIELSENSKWAVVN